MANLNDNRIVVLIDMDCFFCQVETKLQPEYDGKPLAVVQYNQWQRGGIIAVNYEAREFGITRHMRGEEAKEKCPDLILASVPCLRGKADTSRYRIAGRDVIDVIRKHCNVIERASVDEAYLDITDIVDKRISTNSIIPEVLITQLYNTFVVGYSEIGKNDGGLKGTKRWISNIFEELEDVQAQKLAIAGIIVEELRADIFAKTGFKCSAGIAQNKILAKLACGLHKPNRQTILPPTSVSTLYSTLPIKKVRNLGGKFGDVVVESLNCNVMGDLLKYSLQHLQKRFDEKTGLWLYNIARGIDNEPVTMRLVTKSIGACKKFPGRQAITSLDVLKHWAGELSAEVCERLEQDREENERRATLLTICYHYYHNKTTVSQSRSCTLNSYKPEKMAACCVDIVSKSTQCPIAYLGVSAGKFIQAKGRENFRNFFKVGNSDHQGKTCTQTEISKIECIQSTNNTIEMKNASNSRTTNVTQNLKTNVKLNEQISKIKTDSSPTSRKLSNLISSLNKRSKKKPFSESKIINSDLNEAINQNEFKESFFVNVFNSREDKLKDAYISETALIELNENKDMDAGDDNLNKNNAGKVESENDFNISKKETHMNDRNKNFKTDGDIVSNKESITVRLKQSTAVEMVQPSSSIHIHENNNVNNEQNIIKIQEIFPNLNDIDPKVVALLPMNLQEEAKLYIKAQTKKDITKESLLKHSKLKNKSKNNTSKEKNGNSIYNFLIKKDPSNVTDVPLKQCLQCYQMIVLSKYNEHCDFHMAENLQRELNKPLLETENVKRKIDMYDVNTNCLKRRPNALNL
ncbi:DNA polymerase eta isoform X2 [Nomia melanderi]|uniref:DNA polymerase eta isoform X2 n=1 Tax=Nomia melanderi TaxID=2448451 RepID=UPI0013043CEB|nr:DNA polymerase eta isoform X2 [Nomia melanderi]